MGVSGSSLGEYPSRVHTVITAHPPIAVSLRAHGIAVDRNQLKFPFQIIIKRGGLPLTSSLHWKSYQQEPLEDVTNKKDNSNKSGDDGIGSGSGNSDMQRWRYIAMAAYNDNGCGCDKISSYLE